MGDSLWISGMVFLAAAGGILLVGSRMARLADRLADRTGLGEAVTGALFLGGSTSLPGIVTSITAAAGGHAELAVSNAIGGIAAQTAFLAVADITYPKANLEHAAASVPNLMQGTLLAILLTLPLLAANSPVVTVWQVHPVTGLLIVVYVYGLRLISQARERPMWGPRRTEATRTDEPEEATADEPRWAVLWLRFGGYAAGLGAAGFLVARSGLAITRLTGLSETAVGALFTAVSTSMPELVTSIAAVQQGALTLAIGDIVGGNSFDVLFLAFSDLFYRGGSLYHAMNSRDTFLITLTILMTAVLLLGLLRREKHGIANIGLESFVILLLYVGALFFIFFT